MANELQYSPAAGGEVLKQFQLDGLSIKAKSDSKFGLQLGRYINTTCWSQSFNSYYWNRNNRFAINRSYAVGRPDTTKFKDLLDFSGKTNYFNGSWFPTKITNRIISGLVGRWMQRSEKIVVTTTDSLSEKDKKDQFDQMEFIVMNRKKLEELQQASGVQLIPQNEEIPADKEELLLWKAMTQRLPEEILYETWTNDVLAANGWFDILKDKCLHDSSETGLIGAEVWMDTEGVIHCDWIPAENLVYSYSNYSDFRDTAWRGYVKSLKISELRKKYGKEFNPSNPNALTEEQIWAIAQTGKEYQIYDKLRWMNQWNISFIRPYDEWNVDTLIFELKTVDSEGYVITKTKQNKSTLIQKASVPTNIKDNQKYIEDSNVNIYRGVYIRDTDTLLEWGIKKNMIRPQDPKESGNAEFSISLYMPQAYNMTNVAIPEKIQQSVDQMMIALFKMEQVVAKMRPTGAAINWDALQEIDYGLGDKNKIIDPKKLYDQTGDIYYRGRDAEGNPIPVPIVELQNTGFIGQMQGLIAMYEFHYNDLKNQLGEDPALITQALQPRVTAENVNTAQESANNATDHFYMAYVYLVEDISKKVSCLLKDSVRYGADVYRSVLGEKDISARIFNTRVQLLPDQQALAKFEYLLNSLVQANPDIVLYIDPFQIMRVAKEDVKMAEILMRRGQKKMIIARQQEAIRNSQLNAQQQQQSAIVAETENRKTVKEQLRVKSITEIIVSKEKQKEALINGFMGALGKGVAIPTEWKGVETELIQNIAMPLFAENVATINNMVNQALADDEEQQEGNGQQGDMGQPMPQDQNQIQPQQ